MTRYLRSLGLPLTALAFSGLLFACGDDGDGGNGGDDTPDAEVIDDTPDAAVDDTPDAAPEPDAEPELTGIDAVCAPGGGFDQIFNKAFECSPFAGALNFQGTDLLTGSSIEQVCRDIVQPQLDSGTVTIDDSKIQACLDFVAATDCLELNLDNFDATPCADIFVGSVALDGECDISQQCAGDAFCAPSDGCGSCQNRLPTGAACVADAQCSDGKCDASNECAAPLGLGDACTGNQDCGGILACDVGNTDTCIDPFPREGDACVVDNDCGGVFPGGLVCVDDPTPDNRTCQRLPAAGEECNSDFQIAGQNTCDFLNYIWCDPSNNTCQAPTTSGLGEPCNAFAVIGSGARRCDSGLLCTEPLGGLGGSPLGVCIEPSFEGEECDTEVKGQLPTLCHPSYQCIDNLCAVDSEFTGECPAPAP